MNGDPVWSRFVLRLNREHPFFACVAMFATFAVDDSVEKARTAGKDIRVSSDFLATLDEKQRFSYLLHQVLHLSLQHARRGLGRRPDVWNVAADIVVNEIIRESTRWEPAPTTARDDEFGDACVEQVYATLLKRLHAKTCSGAISDPDTGETSETNASESGVSDTGRGDSTDPNPACQSAPSVADEPNEPNEPGKPNEPGEPNEPSRSSIEIRYGAHHDLHTSSTDSLSARDIEQYWKRALLQARTALDARDAGQLPAGFRREYEEATGSRVDWRQALWRHVTARRSDYSEFDLRHIHRGLYVEQLQVESLKLAVAVDTSGSISARELGLFLVELRAILRLTENVGIDLYYCDAKADGPHPFDGHRHSRYHPRGGGGTSFVPFFERLHEIGLADAPDAAIYFTDGHGKFPPSPPAVPVLWVLVEDGVPARAIPFGRAVTLADVAT